MVDAYKWVPEGVCMLGGDCSTWSCPGYIGHTHPRYTSCGDRLLLLFTGSGKVIHAKLEKCFAKTL